MKKAKAKPRALVFALLAALAASCGQDPVFHEIAMEQPPRTGRILGGPSKMVAVGGDLFVASGSLYQYRGGAWADDVPQPPSGRIVDIAAAGSSLYALTIVGSGTSARLYRREGAGWSEPLGLPEGHSIGSIHGDGGAIFIGARSGESSSVWRLSGNSAVRVAEGTGALTGAAGGFLSTTSGLLSAGGGRISGGDGVFVGIIATGGGQVVAVERNGGLYSVGSGGASRIMADGEHLTTGGRATGALAMWNANGQMLVAGRNSSNFNNGYVEFGLGSNGLPNSRRDAGSGLLSVDSDSRFRTSLGRLSVNHLAQAPDRTLFASTQSSGLWAYRVWDGVAQWNAED
jgi:hypothetical protein